MSEKICADIIVIGAGIAGASVAAELAKDAHVVLLEMESQPGYHTTGRSAALFAPVYGPKPIRALTRASEAFFTNPPSGFAEHALIAPRGIMMVAHDSQLDALQQFSNDLASEATIERLDACQVREIQPLLRASYVAGGVLDNSAKDIDVHALHHGYLRQLKALGGVLVTNAEVIELKQIGSQSGSQKGSQWQVDTKQGVLSAPTVVNAAGAWADSIGALAGAETIGLLPKRRTALMVAAPEGLDLASMPATIDIDEQFYLKPDAGRLLISPANEDPEVPCDVQPDEMDIAICIDRIERAFDLKVQRIENRWAGLRSFVADKSPVAGFSNRVAGFYWLAGQGGYGIQSAPALARFAASQVLGKPMADDLRLQGLDAADLSPARL